MADPCDAGIVLVSVTHGATALPIPTGFAWTEIIQDVVIRDAGSIYPDCRGIFYRDCTCVVDFLVAPAIAPDTGPADLTIVINDAEGDTITVVLKNMVARARSEQMNRDSPPALHRQEFVRVGASANSDITGA